MALFICVVPDANRQLVFVQDVCGPSPPPITRLDPIVKNLCGFFLVFVFDKDVNSSNTQIYMEAVARTN